MFGLYHFSDLLKLTEEKRVIAWKILDSVITKHSNKPEILLALLATKATDKEVPQLNVDITFDPTHFLVPHAHELLSSLTKREIPSK